MAHRLKTLSVALVAVFALSAVVAVAAQAAKYKSEIGTTTFIHGTQVTQNVFTIKAGTVKCEVATFTGQQSGSEAPDLTITPKYEKCKAFGQNATVTMNGCQYTFKEPTGAGPFSAPVEIVNCGANRIEVDVPTGNCTLRIDTVGPVGGGVDLTNQGTGASRDVLVTATATGISATNLGPGTICGTVGVADTTGTYTGTVTTKGYSDAGFTAQVGVFVG